MEKFTCGLLLGMLAGALVVANSYKIRLLVKKSQDEVKTKLDEMVDEKIQMMESATETQTPKKRKA